jgi:putative sigma-54 modulation protein
VQVNISARHGHLSAETQDKIAEKAEKLRRLFDRVMAIEVIVDLEHRETPTVELRVSAEHVDDFVAIETSSGIMAALDGAIHKVEQQLRKHKERRRDHRSQPLGRIEPREVEEAEEAGDVEEA